MGFTHVLRVKNLDPSGFRYPMNEEEAGEIPRRRIEHTLQCLQALQQALVDSVDPDATTMPYQPGIGSILLFTRVSAQELLNAASIQQALQNFDVLESSKQLETASRPSRTYEVQFLPSDTEGSVDMLLHLHSIHAFLSILGADRIADLKINEALRVFSFRSTRDPSDIAYAAQRQEYVILTCSNEEVQPLVPFDPLLEYRDL